MTQRKFKNTDMTNGQKMTATYLVGTKVYHRNMMLEGEISAIDNDDANPIATITLTDGSKHSATLNELVNWT